MLSERAKRIIKDWLIILASLADDAAVALVILLILWLLKVPITLPIIVFLILFLVVFTLIMHKLVIPAYHRKKVTGAEGMIGLEGEVIEPLKPEGQVKVKGEYWKAKSAEGDIKVGERVEVVGVEGLILKVKHKEK